MSSPTRILSLGTLASRFAARPSYRAAAFAILALVTTWPLLATATLMNTFRDAQVLFAYERDAAWSVSRFWNAPLWDPYYCGGLFALGTPQSRFASPTFLLSLVLGPARGEAMTIFVMILLGLEGTFRYARERGGGTLGSFLAAPTFALSGTFIASPFLGWTNFFGFELVPWVLVFLRHSLRGDIRAGAYASLFCAWIVGFGGTYAAPFTLLLCGWESTAYLVPSGRSWRERWRAIVMLGLVAMFTLGAGAVRLAPLAETLYAAPRIISGRPGTTVARALDALVIPVAVTHGNLASSKQMYTVGVYALAVAGIGLARRKSWPLVVLGCAAFSLALGYAAGSSGPFALLKHLPLFSVLRYPERYLVIVALVVAATAANGVGILQVLGRGRRWVTVGLVIAGGLLLVNTSFLVRTFRTVAAARLLEPAPPELPRGFMQARGNRWRAAVYAPMSRGSLSCWDAYPVPMSPALRGDLPAEEYLRDPTAGSVSRAGWSPNAIDLDVFLTRPNVVAVNQNFHPGWRSNIGQVKQLSGLLSVALPAGSYHLRLRFRPRSAIAGAVSSVAALIAMALAIWSSKRRAASAVGAAGNVDPRYLGVAAAPLVLFTLVYLSVPEEVPSPAPLRAPSGERIVVSELPRDARVIEARFDDAVALEGIRMPSGSSLTPGEPVSIELDWRLLKPFRGRTEVIVSIEESGHTLRKLNHELISAALPFSQAPPGPILRDVVSFLLPKQLDSGVDVWVGLRDPESRSLMVTASTSATRGGEQVLAGSLDRSPNTKHARSSED